MVAGDATLYYGNGTPKTYSVKPLVMVCPCLNVIRCEAEGVGGDHCHKKSLCEVDGDQHQCEADDDRMSRWCEADKHTGGVQESRGVA